MLIRLTALALLTLFGSAYPCAAEEPIGRSGRPVATQQYGTFSDPLTNVAPPLRPYYCGQRGACGYQRTYTRPGRPRR
ncbi:hypothetical protein JQ604_01210 [Bradyrhizobium jicamae]|uniref:hypothetical protein n=1 Tax=Bradyrhizobium jicamae TaxID=280332 RepID=UPI001BAD6A84|nr:hypothetical protein [Bradyrhizobium jicamae]MBR0750797.1 hypothetical protein [Bradyrhizobium jicamae]